MIKIPSISTFQFHGNNGKPDSPINTESIHETKYIYSKFVKGEVYEFMVWTDGSIPSITSSVGADITVEEYSVVDTEKSYLITVTFIGTGIGQLTIDGAIYSQTFKVVDEYENNIRQKDIKLEYTNFENDYGYYFIENDVNKYYQICLKALSQNRKTYSERETFETDNNKEETIRATSSGGLTITLMLTETEVDIMNAIMSCSEIVVNDVSYNPIGALTAEPINKLLGLYTGTIELQRAETSTSFNYISVIGQDNRVVRDDNKLILKV